MHKLYVFKLFAKLHVLVTPSLDFTSVAAVSPSLAAVAEFPMHTSAS
jgi:hypothetical protein